MILYMAIWNGEFILRKVDIREIDFNLLDKNLYQGDNSVTYVDKNKEYFYKKITGLKTSELNNLYRKYLKMEEDGFYHEKVMLPETLLMSDSMLTGYITKYVKNSKDIGIKYDNRHTNVKDFMNAIYKTSLLTEEIHKKNLIIQDMNLGNVLEDSNGSIYFCDLDASKYGNFRTDFISQVLFHYKIFINLYNVNRSIDNFSLYLSMLTILFQDSVLKINQDTYDAASEKYEFLSNSRQIFNSVKSKNVDIYNFPYLHEIIDKSDIDKIKTL